MKTEIKLLRKAQKLMWENQYPGYPFQLSVIVDLEDKCAWVDYCGHKTNLDKALTNVNSRLIYSILGAKNTSKRTFIIDQHLEEYKKYLEYDYNDFGIENLNACRFYFALTSAIFNHKKTDTGFIFAVIDDESDYIDVQVFKDKNEIEKYVNDYFLAYD